MSDLPLSLVRDPGENQVKEVTSRASRSSTTILYIMDIHDDNKLLEEIVVKLGVESVSNPAQRAQRWDEITKTFNELSLTLTGKTMTKDQVRRKWNNMKKLTRKKWESFENNESQQESQNLDNFATFEIIRQEEDTGGVTSTTILVMDRTEQEKAKRAARNYIPPTIAALEQSSKTVHGKESGSREKSKADSGDDEDEDDEVEVEAGEDELTKRKKKRKKKREEEEDEFREALEKFGPLEELQAKKRLRLDRKYKNAENSFLKKKLEIEESIKEYQSKINMVQKINNELEQKILDKKIDIEILEDEIQKFETIL